MKGIRVALYALFNFFNSCWFYNNFILLIVAWLKLIYTSIVSNKYYSSNAFCWVITTAVDWWRIHKERSDFLPQYAIYCCYVMNCHGLFVHKRVSTCLLIGWQTPAVFIGRVNHTKLRNYAKDVSHVGSWCQDIREIVRYSIFRR